LQIIDPHTFETAQDILTQRSTASKERNVPLNTKGSSLLSGNIYCGHCGARLIVTTNGKKRTRKDGEVTVTPRTRYVCYNRTRHSHLCDGQTGYTVGKLDAIMEAIVRDLFERLNDVPKDTIIAQRYASRIAEYQKQLATAKAVLQADTTEVLEYEAEVIKVIRGESKLNPDLLNKLHEEAKIKAAESELAVKRLVLQIQDGEQMKDSLSQQFDNLRTWADMYDGCDMETKKMILSRIMKAVKVSRDYEIEIDFTVDFEQIGDMADPGSNCDERLNDTPENLKKAVSF
jgi:transposase-like protein